MSMKHLCALTGLLLASCLAAQTPGTPPAQPWWKGAVLYEIYPRSFQDSNNDGIGDLNGITSRLDYLKTLGVDAIWLSPIYPSPQVDFGYDISNYEDIDPQYGTLKDFDHLVAEAKKRNTRIIMDMVLNHTSDKHPWFIASRSSKTDPKRNWYVWRDGKGPGQPDLNWTNPQVRKAMYDVVRFWINRGVSGFRLDAITTLFEDPQWRDDAEIKDASGKTTTNNYGDVSLDDAMTNNLPQVNDVLRDLRQVANSYKGRDIVLIGETYLKSIDDLKKMYGANNDELQLPMDMQIGFINKLDVSLFRQRINEVQNDVNGNEPMIVFDNHDNPRWDRTAA